MIPENLRLAMPERVRRDIDEYCKRSVAIEEIRLHAGRRITLTCAGRNLPTSSVLSRAEIDGILTRLCEGSVYAHRDTITEGYISLRGGVRVGVCGRAAMSGGKIAGVYDIDTLVIRIPHKSPPLGREIVSLIEKMDYTRGVLIYSPPGVGKTTLLRSVAASIASGGGARRVSVVDTRGELAFSLDSPALCLDLLSGYPKAQGIALAARALGSQVIICDEIGSRAEADAIREAHNCGVPLIASAHAGSVRELFGRSGMAELHRSGCFGAYVGISRRGGFGFSYDICMSEDAQNALV